MFVTVIVICAVVLLVSIIAITNKSGKSGTSTIDQTIARNLALSEQKIGNYTAKVQSGAGYILYDAPTHRIILNKEVIDSSSLKYYRATENEERHYYLFEVLDDNGVVVYKLGVFNLDMYTQVKEFFIDNLNLTHANLTPKEIYANKMEALINTCGQPTKVIQIESNHFDKQIIVFEEHNLIRILGKEYKMNDILDCTYDDSSYVKKGDIVSNSTTKTSTGSMLGRAAVGGAVFGTAGAVLGGATAKKNTTTVSKQGADETIHNYTVSITVNSLSSPVIKIECGKKLDLVNEIVGLMNVIIKRNNS